MRLALAAGVAVAVALPPAASAALFLMFGPATARPGAIVTVRTGGNGALAGVASSDQPVRVFLAAGAGARLVPLGRLRIDPAGNGTLRFVVPQIAPGPYEVLIRCVPCAPFSAGRELLPGGMFTVLSSSETRDRSAMWIVIASAAAVAVGGTLAWALRRGRRPGI